MASDDGWGTEEAQVACAQLGYTTGTTEPVTEQ